MECVDSSELIEGQTCEQAIATYGPRVCYNTFFESHCCATCTAQQTGIPGNSFGSSPSLNK
ncbi:hypothetical protein DPMN_167011 [Dreissena polymorpha]|uniref:Uncharacterized protein n=1 Tax=Dreissena polymorpha TaxID=45954 RepID=A0A9D4F020_DREPO|nr:hypothetical protein DPMN_167011 [Dreissena polymorpha]